jgi:hypothetical protein
MSADLLSSATSTLAQLQQQSAVQLASLTRACIAYTPSLRLDHILDADGVVPDANQLSFDLFATWTLLFLLLYVAFALLLRLVPGTGLQKGKLPFIASSRCTCSANKQSKAQARATGVYAWVAGSVSKTTSEVRRAAQMACCCAI